MVERLKVAIEKARAQRAGAPPADRPTPPEAAPRGPADPWSALPAVTVDERRLERERIITYNKSHPSHVAFDVLRTRLLKTCKDNGWSVIGLVSPRKGCGKSLLSCNLAFSAARRPEIRTVLLDLDLRAPRVAHKIGVFGDWRISRCLRGEADWPALLRRVGANLAVGLNSGSEPHPAEVLQSQSTSAAMARLRETFRPDLVVVDLPPLLAVDDAIGFLHNLDAVIMVAAAGSTRAKEIAECEALISASTNLLGVVLNKFEGVGNDSQLYAYEAD